MQHTRLAHAPALTGVRAIAVLVVMVYHAGIPIYGGHLGVNVFFVLSGFLITHLLVDEMAKSGRIAFGNFYARRALRLYPALLALVAVIAIYSLLAPEAIRADQSLAATPAVLLYFGNWIRAFRGEDAGASLGLYEHTWSLAIEEQFYLVWPVVIFFALFFTRRLVWAGIIIALGIVGSFTTRLLIAPDGEGLDRISNGLDTQADQLLMGAAMALTVIAVQRAGRTNHAARLLRYAFWPAVVILGAGIVLWPHHGQQWWLRIVMLVVAMSAAVIIGALYLNQRSVVARGLATAPARWIGDRSYGLYLWHYPVFTVLINPEASMLQRGLMALLGFALSFAVAHASFELVEKPFLRLKDRLARKERAREDATVEGLSAPNPSSVR